MEELSGFATVLHSGQLEYNEREEVVQKFQRGDTKILITTDVLSRGLNGHNVVAVVNFNLPLNENPKRAIDSANVNMITYINRIGRAGRFGTIEHFNICIQI